MKWKDRKTDADKTDNTTKSNKSKNNKYWPKKGDSNNNLTGFGLVWL